MLPPACTLCGSPLPAVPTDPAHPDWCPSCAARAIGAPGPTSAVPPPQPGAWAATVQVRPGDLVVKARIPEGILVGIAAAAIGGAIWWGVAAATQSVFPYLALLVGVLTGQGVLIGARRGGPVQALLAGVFCIVAMLVAQYFAARSVTLHENPGLELPLWQGFDFARRVVQDQVQHHVITAICFAIAWIVAVATAAFPNRRPAI